MPPHVKTITLNDVHELCIFFEFAKSEWSHYRGFVITYQVLGTFFILCLVLSIVDLLSTDKGSFGWLILTLNTYISTGNDQQFVGNAKQSQAEDSKEVSDAPSWNLLQLIIAVPKLNQTKETLKLFRKLLANSTNKYIKAKQIQGYECRCLMQLTFKYSAWK